MIDIHCIQTQTQQFGRLWEEGVMIGINAELETEAVRHQGEGKKKECKLDIKKNRYLRDYDREMIHSAPVQG